MSELVLLNSKVYLEGFDISGDLNKIGLKFDREAKESTRFGNATKRRLMGLKDVSFDHAGLFQAGDAPDLIDHVTWDRLGLTQQVMTVSPTTGAVGETAFMFRGIPITYSFGAPVGEILAFQVSGAGCCDMARGQVMESGAKTVTGSGTAVNLGALTAAQKMFVAVHIIGITGTLTPTITLKVQSDDAQGFATPTDQISLAAATAIGSQWGQKLGAVADTWWRLSWTISGTNPSLTIVASLGITN